MNKKIIIVSIILIAISFYGGMKLGQSKTGTPSNQDPRSERFSMGQTGARTGLKNGGSMTVGEILSKNESGITVKLQGGGSKIILTSKSTSVMKTVLGGIDDLSVGKQVSVFGSTNTDGSITAESIQIRQATSTAGQKQPIMF